MATMVDLQPSNHRKSKIPDLRSPVISATAIPDSTTQENQLSNTTQAADAFGDVQVIREITHSPVEPRPEDGAQPSIRASLVMASDVETQSLTSTAADSRINSIVYLPSLADQKAKDRDPTWLPLIIRKANGTDNCVWAKLDTGASANFINEELLDKIEAATGKQITRNPNEAHHRRSDKGLVMVDHYSTINSVDIPISSRVSLEFGVHEKQNLVTGEVTLQTYTAQFELLEQHHKEQYEKETNDGAPHLLLGAPWLTKHHILSMDPAFMPPYPELEALEPKSEDNDICFFLHKAAYVNAPPQDLCTLQDTRGIDRWLSMSYLPQLSYT